MGDYTIFHAFENPRRGRQARNFTTNVPKILDLKSSSEQIFFRKLSLGAPDVFYSFLFRPLGEVPFSLICDWTRVSLMSNEWILMQITSQD